MNIRPKVMILLTLVFMALSAIALAIQDSVLMPSFARLERVNAETAMHRVRHAVNNTLDALEMNAQDWANWDDVYQFVENHNEEFVRRNITPTALNQLQLQMMLVVDREGRIVMSSNDTVPTGIDLQGVLLSGSVLREDFRWRQFLGTLRTGRGLIKTNRGVLMIAGAPILDGAGGGTPRGMVIIGRLLTPELVRRMEAQTETVIALMTDMTPISVDRIVDTDTDTQIYGAFSDVFGRPALTLCVDVPRDITAYGRRAIMVATGSLIAATLVTFLLLLTLINRYVLRPLTRLTRHAVAVGENPELTQRLEIKDADEFGKLAHEFDRMVDRLALTRRDLVDQSFQAGFAEMAKTVLHNLGNALTPMGVRLSAMERRVRESPAADLELAAGELAASDADPARRAALIEFLTLGCREMHGAVKETAADIELLQRQASLMSATLNEQSRSSNHRAPVVEAVGLPELISQTLDIVPEASRRRLRLQIDESVQKIGTVRLARSVLRMVLQNLIINAADAVRDAGKDTGVLRVIAQIVPGAERNTLHLQCQDDGMGIPADKLETVFEKGYSTKAQDGNQGISLHWCANAMRALGGRIWATSDGPGCGTSLHLQLPV